MKVFAQIIKKGSNFIVNQMGTEESSQDNVVFEFNDDDSLAAVYRKPEPEKRYAVTHSMVCNLIDAMRDAKGSTKSIGSDPAFEAMFKEQIS